MNLEEIYAPIKQDLEEVEERLATIVASEVYPVRELYDYVLSSGGKRIRPALVLLSAKSLDYNSSMVMDLACAVELIHMASLIHDDIIDSAKLRRGKPAAHLIWSTEVAVTIGDYLFSHAMEILTKYNDHEVSRTFSKAVKCMAEGELLQAANHRNMELTEQGYIKIVSSKTASLMSACCETVAKLAFTDLDAKYSSPDSGLSSSHPPYQMGAGGCYPAASIEKALSQYGLNLGISYQIMDDVFDLISTDEQLGKPAKNSIREGNLTLPIIHTLEDGSPELTKKRLLSILSNEEEINDMELQEVIDLVSNSGAFSYTRAIAEGYVENAKKALAILKDSMAKQCLLSFANFIVNGYLTEVSKQLAIVGIQ